MSKTELQPGGPGDAGRRAFLLGTAALFAAPLAISGCRRRSVPDTPPVAPLAGPVIVRVRLNRPVESVYSIGLEKQWLRLDRPDVDPSIYLLGPVRVTRRGDAWLLRDASGFQPDLAADAAFSLCALRGETAADTTAVDGNPFPGSLRAVPTSTSMDLVNHVDLESYLPGVLARELFRDWHGETFAAQAVAARSFAVVETELRAHSHFDLRAGPISQAYIGATDHARSLEAVARTRGQVLTVAGSLVPGYYSSCCGGTAARAVDAIGDHPINSLAPLQGRSSPDACSNAPRYRWSITRRRADVEPRLRTYGEERGIDTLARLKRLTSINVDHVNLHGRPTRYVVSDSERAVCTLEAEPLRRAVSTRVAGLGSPKTLHSSDMRVKISGSDVTFNGRGFGHGVGLCQYGAQALAKEGVPYEEIVTWYYPGATMGPRPA